MSGGPLEWTTKIQLAMICLAMGCPTIHGMSGRSPATHRVFGDDVFDHGPATNGMLAMVRSLMECPTMVWPLMECPTIVWVARVEATMVGCASSLAMVPNHPSNADLYAMTIMRSSWDLSMTRAPFSRRTVQV